jgi:hypothetical protein
MARQTAQFKGTHTKLLVNKFNNQDGNVIVQLSGGGAALMLLLSPVVAQRLQEALRGIPLVSIH